MNDKSLIAMGKIKKYAQDALLYTKNMDFDAFIADGKTISATAFVLGQIGELVNKVNEETQTAASNINWRGMRGLRNRITHDYENIDMKMLWDIVKTFIPELIEQIDAYLIEG